MFEKLEIFSMAQALARHGAARQAVIAENVANADTPGYRARDLPGFDAAYRGPAGAPLRGTRPGHFTAGFAAAGPARADLAERPNAAAPNGNTVSLEEEIFAATQAKREHDRALAIYRSALTILRTAASGQR